jgi:opacity protein-like surface antigen
MKKIKLVLLTLIFTGTLISAQSKFGIGINGAYVAPTGDYADLYKSGFGGIASLTYDVTDHIQLSASTGFAQQSFNNDKFNELLNSFGIETKVDVDSKIKIIPILVGAKYFLTNTEFKPYTACDFGVHIVSISASKITVEGRTFDAAKEQSKAAMAWSVGVGFLYKVAPKINIDINAKINGNNLEVGNEMSTSGAGYSSSSSSKSTLTFFTVAAGVLFEL